MRLVVLVPFVPGVNTVEVPGFTGSVLVLPMVGCGISDILFDIEELLFLIQISLSFGSIQCFRSKVNPT